MNGDLILCGWRIRSALPLPGLLAWPGDDRPPDVEISVGAIPESDEKPVLALPHSRVWSNGAFLLEMANIGRFWVEGGRRVLLEPADGASEPELRAFLLGSVLGVLCHQRGLLPMHASAVRIEGRAVLFAGNSGAGKSTLAAALGARGHALVADDVVAFDPINAEVLPAFPQRKLATDVLEALSLESQGLVANRPGQPKFHVPASQGYDAAPLPPSLVFLLTSVLPRDSHEMRMQDSAIALAQLDRAIYRRKAGAIIQTHAALFRALSRLAQAAPVHVLPVEKGLPLSELDRLAGRVESHVLNLARR
jgi:hypothetical protein